MSNESINNNVKVIFSKKIEAGIGTVVFEKYSDGVILICGPNNIYYQFNLDEIPDIIKVLKYVPKPEKVKQTNNAKVKAKSSSSSSAADFVESKSTEHNVTSDTKSIKFKKNRAHDLDGFWSINVNIIDGQIIRYKYKSRRASTVGVFEHEIGKNGRIA